MDYSLYKDVNGLSGTQPFDGLFKFCANDLVFVMVALVALLFLVPWRRRALERRRAAVTAVPALLIGLLVAKIVGDAVDRVRPFVAHHGHAHLLIHHAADASFPSDHTTGAFAMAVAVWLYDKAWGALLLVLAAIVGFARVYVGVHYPADVVGGALIGSAVAIVLFLPPIRRRLVAIADACSGVYERLLATAGLRRPARVEG